MTRAPGEGLDEPDRFVHAAVRAFARSEPSPPPPPPETWWERARDAGVLAVIVDGLLRAGQPVPELASMMRTGAAARQLATMQDAHSLGVLFDRVGIEWAVLKGPLLTDVIYQRPGVRDYTDLDVLVRPDQVELAVRGLVETGARVLPTDWTHIARARTAELPIQLPYGTVLDLHWSLINRGQVRDGFRLSTRALLRDRVAHNVDGVALPALSDPDTVLHVLLHGCLSGGSSLRWALDAQQCVRWLAATPRDLAERAATLGVVLPAQIMLDRAATYVDEGVRPWAAAMGRPGPWSRLLREVGRRRPPSAPSRSRSTGSEWFGATRSTAGASVRAAARVVSHDLRYRRTGWPEPTPVAASVEDPGFRAWLAVATAEADR